MSDPPNCGTRYHRFGSGHCTCDSRSDRELQIGVTEFRTLWNPSSLGATELWLGLTGFTSLGSKIASVSPSLTNRQLQNAFCGELKLSFWVIYFAKTLHFVMLIHSVSSTSIHRVNFQFAVSTMSDQSDSQNRSEEQVNMSEGTSPSSSSDEGRRSTPSNLPKASTRQRK